MSSTVRLLRLATIIAAVWITSAVPARAQTVYAAVWGDPRHVVGSSTLNSGLFRSTDTGRTWVHFGPNNLKTFSMDAVDAERGRVLFIAAGNGVHRSVDSGRSWKIVTDWRVTEVLDVHVVQSDPRRILAATAFGLWVSDDGGETWSNPTSDLQRVYVFELYGTTIVYARTQELRIPSGHDGFYDSENAGQSWSLMGGMLRDSLQIDSFATHGYRPSIGTTTFGATWGGGVYRNDGSGWLPGGLEGTQVSKLVLKEY